ncbi:MAG: S49 family peptidase [Magnetospirillum sp.]|nr:S49 family peptidase [Magnetospirillum sp.]
MDIAELIEAAVERVTSPPPLVSVVRMSGLIAAGGGFMRGTLNIANLAPMLEAAFRPRRLAAVALVINSPGGSAAQSALIGRRLRQHAAEKPVPVVAFVEDVAASGGYWLAAAADEIFADETSIIGSVGVVSAGFGLQEAIGRLGIERRLHTSGERKRMLDPFLPEKPDDVARLKALQSDIHESFKAWVRSRRQDRLAAGEDELFNGDVWTGKQALGLGLIDGIGDLRSVMRARYGETVRLRMIGERRSWLRRRFGLDQAGTAAAILTALEERLARAHWGL